MPSRLQSTALARGRPRGAKSFSADVAQTYGEIVRNARVSAGISQEALAHMADLERSYFGRIERGQSQPTLYVVLKISAALAIESAVLIEMVEQDLRRKRLASLRS